ncbi:carbonic anhydrase family protein [Halomonas sp. DP8Y7-3]|uniref:carbonic anhydrase n=1 Tax=Halomonas sp. DP8Y7-3 TaxID=2859079 RepID=UPI001C9713DB|nr:carbonic anhydrase family protein [Halomonas sp. DP8Y7-3]MBY5930088.1 carbonic anhydrase family protein [Halomonas sp. DP8Y7-3]
MTLLKVTSFLSCALFTCSALAATEAPHWSYQGETGPAHWAELSDSYEMCGLGHNQSPVDIAYGVDAALAPLELSYGQPGTAVVNNGHTVQVASSQDNTLTLDGDVYTLLQMHFHAPSEHTVDGRQFPLEAHLVHANKEGDLAVVSVMFDEGEQNAVFDGLVASLPSSAGDTAEIDGGIDFAQVLPEDQEYFRLNGSLTTPPCTEGVRWLVMKAPQSLSSDQITAFAQAIGVDNNRPIQPRNARVVIE